MKSADRTLVDLAFALECLDNKTIPEQDQDRFYQAITSFYRYNFMTANIPTYEEMKSSGHLGLIKNDTMKSKINEYLIATEASTKIMESLGNTIQSNQIYYEKYIRSSADPETLNLSFRQDFKSMKKDEE